MSGPVLIEIDLTACVGSAVCATLVDSVFLLDSRGQATVRDPAGAPVADILEAAEGCPTMAIRVRDAASGELLFPPNSFGS